METIVGTKRDPGQKTGQTTTETNARTYAEIANVETGEEVSRKMNAWVKWMKECKK